MAHECVRDGLLPLLLDLDETVVKAYPIGKLTREIDCLSKKMQDQPECALSSALQLQHCSSGLCRAQPEICPVRFGKACISHCNLCADERYGCRLRECLQREIDLLREDHALMQQFTENGCVANGKESMQPR